MIKLDLGLGVSRTAKLDSGLEVIFVQNFLRRLSILLTPFIQKLVHQIVRRLSNLLCKINVKIFLIKKGDFACTSKVPLLNE